MFYSKRIKLLERRINQLEAQVLANKQDAENPVYSYKFRRGTFISIFSASNYEEITLKEAVTAIAEHLGVIINRTGATTGTVRADKLLAPKKKAKKRVKK